ncbi:hypothetical protein BKA67DRAFT_658088 [Truncatella angustata]|uniref:Fumarylacetoacetase-like C-terminal domain-containing protein n=1 Tax=Truncatella angustata TaxID=152316 RepID=A0A9P8UKN5_9PEZI|nr:uncharacterized protein BKA67DRAFT_658088 [Truncatella angustata]KAH6653745.1 hypothetical protein BKA67DRAFT_658088 [Truncatella angustata]
MRYHRINNEIQQLPDSGIPSAAAATPPSSCPDLLASVLTANPPDAQDPLKRALPFQPRSYRDFMLFEDHYYGAALGSTSLWRSPPMNPPALWYRQPIFYQSNHLAFYADGAPVHCPSYAEYLDVELELGIVLGGELFNATPEEAEEAVAGFCVFNDFSVRNGQMEEMSSGFGPQHSKCFANSISSVVVSADEVFPMINKLTGRVIINEVVVSECRADSWQFSVGQALAHASKSTRLYPGEFFGSGTFPAGAGIEHARFQLKVGDIVRLEIDEIGSVTNTIVTEK